MHLLTDGLPPRPEYFGRDVELNRHGATALDQIPHPRLEGREGFRIYEQMRRSDADVAAALAACKLPIRAADWQVVPAEESVRQPTDRSQESEGSKTSSTGAGRVTQAKAKEVAEFVRENLFGGLESPTLSGHWMTQSFESVIENALLSLDFGCAAHEDLWHVEGGRVRLRRLAGRLPLTFYRFHVEPDGPDREPALVGAREHE